MARDYDYDEIQRFVSVDALRGFDMLCIVGAGGLARSLQSLTDQPWAKVLHEQLEHVAWDGFHFYDLIFPLFVFLVGVSTVFSLERIVDEDGRGKAYRRILSRGILLYLLGIFYHGGMGDPEQFRLMGVLHRIAICYVVGAILYLHLSWSGLLAVSVLLLGGYWALLSFVPVPGHGAANFQIGTNLANYVDAHFLPGYKWEGDWDPEGLLSTLPAIVSGILGIFAGMLLRDDFIGTVPRLLWLVLLGTACLAAGYGWHIAPAYECPIIKKIWTPSFVLYAAGWSFLLVAAFHLVIDVWRVDFWARPLVWVGMNPITIYMLNNLVGGYRSLLDRIILDHWLEKLEPSVASVGMGVLATLIPIVVAWILYRNRAFIRL